MRIDIARLSASHANFAESIAKLGALPPEENESIQSVVREILAAVRLRGDEAVLEYTRRFDRIDAASIEELEITRDALESALASLTESEKGALIHAADRIREFHSRQNSGSWSFEESDGTVLGQKVTPLDRVGVYVPGGKASYPSSVLMNVIPAKVAGVGEVVMVVPTPGGERNPLVLAAAAISGVDRVLALGGAQAIGALAFGTRSIRRVDKIVGPGNAYVASAKREVFGLVGIDMVAGPSEILIICDGNTPADWIAMDMFSQAEHDELAQSILVSDNAAYLDEVCRSMERLLDDMPRRDIIAQSLAKRGALIHVRDLQGAVDVANLLAPEHLELSVEAPEALLAGIRHAGAIFLGRYTPEALGDYCAGPNHVLPTSGSARFSSPLGVYDFQKRSSIVGVTRSGANRLAPVAATLARGEGLVAHARSAEYRMGVDR
jgi:histidinol dehydrogenase